MEKCENCPYEQRIAALEESSKKVSDLALQSWKDTGIILEKIDSISVSMERLFTENKELKQDIQELKGKSSKKWDDLIKLIIASAVGYIASLVFKGGS